MAMTSGQLELAAECRQKDLETRVMGMPEPVVGKGKVRAKISARVDFQLKIEKTEEKYDPDSQVVRSEQAECGKI